LGDPAAAGRGAALGGKREQPGFARDLGRQRGGVGGSLRLGLREGGQRLDAPIERPGWELLDPLLRDRFDLELRLRGCGRRYQRCDGDQRQGEEENSSEGSWLHALSLSC